MLLLASFSARILPWDQNFSWKLFWERFPMETSFSRYLSCGKTAACKSIVERQTSCAKTCAWFLQNHSDPSGKKFSHETKFALQDKTKKKHSQPKMKPCSSRFLVLIWDEACWRPHWPACCSHATQADRSEGELRLRRKTTTGQILLNLPVQTKKNKALVPVDGHLAKFIPFKAGKHERALP